MFILEEVYEFLGFNFYDIVRLCVNVDYCLVFMVMLFMKDLMEVNMCLMVVVGWIEIKVIEKYLIDWGILVKLYFFYYKVVYKLDEVRIKVEFVNKYFNFRVGMSIVY